MYYKLFIFAWQLYLQVRFVNYLFVNLDPELQCLLRVKEDLSIEFSGSINISWKNGKLHGITALEINFSTSNQLLVNINQLFETLEKKK